MIQEKKTLFLLDAMALIYRAYYALNRNPRITSKGLNTSAVYGFANTLLEVLENQRPEFIGIATDLAAPTLRQQGFSAYKAQRQPMPDELSASLPYIYSLIEAFNIPLLGVEGYEADDIIGTLAVQAEKKGFEIFMMTSDKDFGQLLTDKIHMYKPGRFGDKAEVVGVKQVCEKYGISNPKQLVDILGLWGDSSDNIPGIPGFGEVTAKALISQFGSIEEMIERVDEIPKERWRSKVKEFSSQALMSKELAKIITDAPVAFDEDVFRFKSPDLNSLNTLLTELEFKTFSKRLSESSIFNGMAGNEKTLSALVATDLFSAAEDIDSDRKSIGSSVKSYTLVDSASCLTELIDELYKSGDFCFDTETTALDPHQAELAGISFAVSAGKAWFIPIPSNYNEALELIRPFKPLFEDESIKKTGQNLKYDMSVLMYYDIDVKGELFDTMIAHYLLEPEQRHNLDYLASKYLNYQTISIESLIGKKGKNQRSIRSVDLKVLSDYACEDADICLQLRYIFEGLLKQNSLDTLFYDIEMPLVPVLVSMETQGVKLDLQALSDFSSELSSEIESIEKSIFTEAGRSFNINSPKQLGEILFDELKIDSKPKLTATKQYSTSEDILQRLSGRHTIIQKILEYRSLSKLKSTYVDALPDLINPRTGRIHTNYNQTVTATGRLSSNNPNLQNIPIRTERGREIRKAFIPRNSDYVLFSADYSQIELRIIASLSGDSAMIADFRAGLDIHTATAARIFDITVDEVDSGMRRKAKMVNFGIIYGISAYGLSERLGIARAEAAGIIEQYFKRYPGIKAYMDKSIEFARENAYVETIMNRRRFLPDITSSNANIRQFAERNAINAPIQGSAADMIKIAMVRIHSQMQQESLASKMILQVHDELVFDVHKDEVEHLRDLVYSIMKAAVKLNVPLEVDSDTGNNWLEAH